VYLIFLYLIYVGVVSSKDRVSSIIKALLITSLFLYLSLSNVFQFPLNIWDISLGVLIGLIFGFVHWRWISKKKIQIDKKNLLVFIPGSWINMFIVLIIFSMKYYLGYRKFLNASYIEESDLKYITLFVSSFSLSVIISRFSNYVYRYIVQKSVHLKI
jgi:phosphoglycerol transferase MdoB-like AlkP superfamily enzyme